GACAAVRVDRGFGMPAGALSSVPAAAIGGAGTRAHRHGRPFTGEQTMLNNKKSCALLLAAGAALLLSGCETTSMKMGSPEAKTVATGSAAGAATSGENTALEKCDSPLGTVSLVENQTAGWYTIL